MISVSRGREDCSHKKFQITAIVSVTLDMKSRKRQNLEFPFVEAQRVTGKKTGIRKIKENRLGQDI